MAHWLNLSCQLIVSADLLYSTIFSTRFRGAYGAICGNINYLPFYYRPVRYRVLTLCWGYNSLFCCCHLMRVAVTAVLLFLPGMFCSQREKGCVHSEVSEPYQSQTSSRKWETCEGVRSGEGGLPGLMFQIT